MNVIILGKRLKRIRESLEFSQKDIADKINCKQIAISNLEQGKGVNLELFLNLYTLYSQFVYTDLILAENFYFIPKIDSEDKNHKSHHWMAIDAINFANNELLERTNNA
jgi:transcriptional regulator with XRE-family HTH domain